MQQIAVWLRKLGVSEHAERFAQNDIDLGILPELAGHDLEKARLPDRRARLRLACSPSSSEPGQSRHLRR